MTATTGNDGVIYWSSSSVPPLSQAFSGKDSTVSSPDTFTQEGKVTEQTFGLLLLIPSLYYQSPCFSPNFLPPSRCT